MSRPLPRVVGTVPSYGCWRGVESCRGRAPRKRSYCSDLCRQIGVALHVPDTTVEWFEWALRTRATGTIDVFTWLGERERVAS